MKTTLLRLVYTFFLLCSTSLIYAGVPTTTKWVSKNPFQQKVFIENKGQYFLQNKVATNEILFGAQLDGLNYYFTKNAIYIEHYKAVKRTEAEMAELNLPADKADEIKNLKAFQYKFVQELHEMDFAGSNSSADIITTKEVNQYYNFKTVEGNIQAHGYKKLIYKNLYPNIDMEVYFPDNKQGFEYSFIVHPGADISQINIQYPLNQGIQLKNGNVIIKSLFGDFTDHAPVANQTSKPIDCSFTLQNRGIQFATGNYVKTKDLIIDPWISTPVFPGSVSDRAYDLDWDYKGNVYAYGGSGQYAQFPLYMLKYDSNGTLLWETQIDDYYTQDYGTELYGDFVVNKSTQSIFVAQGVNIVTGAKIIKMDQSGAQVDSFLGNSSMDAMFRIAYSTQYNELVGVGGSYPNYPAPTAIYVDTNLTTGNVVYVNNPANPYHYMWGVALDNSGNCYMAISGRNLGDTTGNDMFKVPMPTLSPTTWEVNDGYEVVGIGDPQYLAHNNGNGFNGMTVSDTNLYTYDSYTLKKWSANTGNLLKTLNINGDSTYYIYWGGLCSDTCGKIFLGSHDTIKMYDSSLTLLNYIVAPDSIYDISVSNNNTLYACGAGFVAAYPLVPTLISSKPDSTVKVCLGNSTTMQAGGAQSYAWSPSTGLNNTTGATVVATPSASTTYTVICTGNFACVASSIDTFRIKVKVDTTTLPAVFVSPTSDTLCAGNNVVLNASGGLTYQWSPIAGLSNVSGSSDTAKPIATTTYIVEGFDANGCYNAAQTVITIDTVPNVSVFPNFNFICPGQSVSIYASGESNYTWSPSTALNTTTGDSVVANPTVTTLYLVSSTGGDGCVGTAASEVYVYPSVNITLTPHAPAVCSLKSDTVIASGARKYEWSPLTGLSDSTGDTLIVNPTVTTTYTVIGLNRFGCADTAQLVFTIDTAHINLTPSSYSICTGQSVSIVASGSANYQWSPSSGLNVTTGDSVVATPPASTTYTVTGIDTFGCNSIGYDTINALTPPNQPTITLKGDTLVSSAATNNQWYFDGKAISGATNKFYIAANDTGWYSVSVINPANGCSNSSDSINYITSGINQLFSSNQITIYPNPFNTFIYVDINSNADDLKGWNLLITDVLGRPLYSSQSVNYSNSIKLSQLPSGVYFVSIINRDKKVVIPIIRQE